MFREKGRLQRPPLVETDLAGQHDGHEEQALLEALGEPYRKYQHRTKRLIPLSF